MQSEKLSASERGLCRAVQPALQACIGSTPANWAVAGIAGACALSGAVACNACNASTDWRAILEFSCAVAASRGHGSTALNMQSGLNCAITRSGPTLQTCRCGYVGGKSAQHAVPSSLVLHYQVSEEHFQIYRLTVQISEKGQAPTQQGTGLVSPAAGHILHAVAPAPQHQHWEIEALHVLQALRMALQYMGT